MQRVKSKIRNSGTHLGRITLPIFSLCIATFIFAFSTFNFAEAATIGKPSNLLTLNSGLVGWWTFDGPDMYPNVRDKSGQGNHGRLVNMSTTTAPGRIGQAMQFDGSNDYITVPAAASLSTFLNGITVSIWMKEPPGVYAGVGISRTGTTNGFAMGYDFPNDWYFGNGSSWSAVSVGRMLDSAWHHYSVVWDTATLRSYRDGVAIASTAATGLTFTSGTMDIGRDNRGGDHVTGLIDDARVYNRALTSQEIAALYRTGQARVGSKTDKSPGTLSQGLVGHWTFDGEDMAPNVRDMSGQGNHGYLMGQSATTTAPGKIGQAISLDGANDYILVPDSATIDLSSTTMGTTSVSFWTDIRVIYEAGSGWDTFFCKDDGSRINYCPAVRATDRRLEMCSDTACTSTTYSLPALGPYMMLVFLMGSSTTDVYVDGLYKATIGRGLGPVNNGPLYIGTYTPFNEFIDGTIDDFRMYNRALSPQEIQQLYNLGQDKIAVTPRAQAEGVSAGLVGHWTFDGKDVNWGSGAVTDKSGNGNTGYVVNMSTTSSIAPGKFGQALKFDGTNDSVSIADSNTLSFGNGTTDTPFSIGAWVYMRDATEFKIFKKGSVGVAGLEYYLRTGDHGTYPDDLIVRFYDPSTNGYIGRRYSTAMTSYQNQWAYISLTYDGSGTAAGIRLYVNGVRVDDADYSGGTYVAMENLALGAAIGTYNAYYANGLVDDVRIYNRELSANEVLQLYQMGR